MRFPVLTLLFPLGRGRAMGRGELEDKQICDFPIFFVLSLLVKVVSGRLCGVPQVLLDLLSRLLWDVTPQGS